MTPSPKPRVNFDEYARNLDKEVAKAMGIPHELFLHKSGMVGGSKIPVILSNSTRHSPFYNSEKPKTITLDAMKVTREFTSVFDLAAPKEPFTGDTILMVDDISRVEPTPNQKFESAYKRACQSLSRKIKQDFDNIAMKALTGG